MTNSYYKYLSDIKNTTPLTAEEEFVMFKLYSENKSIAIRNKIAESNMKFVLKTVFNYKSSNVNIEDLISAGSIGMIKAIDQFDYTRGQRFITYAIWWIKSYIIKTINEKKPLIHIPWNKVVTAIKAKKKDKDMLTDADIEAINATNINKSCVSLDSTVNSDSKHTYADIIADHKSNTICEDDNMRTISMLLDSLPENEKYVLSETYGINSDKPHTLREIGSAMDCSHSKVKQIRDRALRRIRKYNSNTVLESIKEKNYE